MPMLDNFMIEIQTGDTGTETPPHIKINGHQVPLTHLEGATDADAAYQGGYAPQSFIHTLTLVGPEEGAWLIKEIKLTFECMGESPYTVRLGEVRLDESNEVNLWRPRPPVILDV